MKLDDIFNKNEIKIIAEIGINHNGNLDDAIKMIKEARESGADAVKFQTFNPDKLYSQYTKSLLEKSKNLKKDREIINFFNQFTFTKEEWMKLKIKADSLQIEFFSAPFDEESVAILEQIGVKLYKIASSEVTNIPLIEKIISTNKPIIMSTGMCNLDEIENAVKMFKNSNTEYVLMHCVSLYPTGIENVNLERIRKLKDIFNCKIGFSDHSPKIKYAVNSIYFGSEYIEKHFTLENYDAPDNCVSIDKNKMIKLRRKIQNVLKIKGSGEIDSVKNQEIVAISARRSLFAKRDIKASESIAESDFNIMRPGVGINPYLFRKLNINKLNKNIKKGEPLQDIHIKGVDDDK